MLHAPTAEKGSAPPFPTEGDVSKDKFLVLTINALLAEGEWEGRAAGKLVRKRIGRNRKTSEPGISGASCDGAADGYQEAVAWARVAFFSASEQTGASEVSSSWEIVNYFQSNPQDKMALLGTGFVWDGFFAEMNDSKGDGTFALEEFNKLIIAACKSDVVSAPPPPFTVASAAHGTLSPDAAAAANAHNFEAIKAKLADTELSANKTYDANLKLATSPMEAATASDDLKVQLAAAVQAAADVDSRAQARIGELAEELASTQTLIGAAAEEKRMYEDSDSRTPCVSCDGISGVYAPEGSPGSCSSHFCAPGTVDLDGMPSTACQACNGVTEYQNKEGQRKCVAVTDCPAGEQEEVAPTPVMDRLCAQCLAGRTFLPEGGNDCVDVSPESGDGFYESKVPTATSDRVCTATTTTSTTTTTTDPCEGVDCSGDSCHEDGTCVNGVCIEGKALADGITCDENTPCLKAGVCLSGGGVATRAKPNGAACFSEHCHGIGEGVCQDGKCGVVDFTNGNAIGWLECDTTTTPTTTATSTETRFSSCSVGFYEVFDCSWYKTKNECSSSDDGFHCSFDNDAGLCMLKSNFTTSTDPDRHRRQSPVQVGGSGDALCTTKELEEPCNSQKGCAWISMFGFNFCDVTANALHARSRRQGGNMFGGGGGKNADIVQRTLPILSWSPLQQPLKPARLLFNVREWIVSFMLQCISTRSNAT